ncbi:RNA polymerase sigma-70 factor, ECF subfamily [plant metagenome]|uniref:RNA polymerase sigma-70 factor, ECF subfamily n=2 Tax=root TaxID=1 RepID=A0A1C3K735_9BURK|nr:sigma-70 family RNA polymerase sigma factor [Orrella dioscoreae]SBT27205.1 RNA polymerase sigma-70 factor, ECF subfamily [Orrella dioscoreae]SOE46099.1 RNA polymerase sigma-70 factor, ECF subfamily [Orrella dioscoreae]
MPAANSPASPIHTLYSDHHGWLRGWLSRRLGNAADAADIAHDVFLRLIVKPAPRGFHSPGEARAYLRVVAQHLCINQWHRREIERAWLQALAERPEEYAPSAERQAMVLEALQEIGAMLLELPSRAAQAFLLAEGCQMTHAEIAAELGVSTRMVRKYIAQAMLGCLTLRARQTAQALMDGRD